MRGSRRTTWRASASPPHRVLGPRSLTRFLVRLRNLAAPFGERLVEVELFDRAVALASQAFVALIPFMVVAAAVLPGKEEKSVADSIVKRFELEGDSAEAVQLVFSQPAEVRNTLSLLGVALLIISALSFCRALQRLYERSWRLPTRGMRETPSHLEWLLLALVYASISGALTTTAAEWLGPLGRIAVLLSCSLFLWLWTPYLLIARRMERRKLRATAALTAVGMTGLSVASVVYMPASIASSAATFGSIGIAIAIVSWLIAAGFVLVVGAAFGAVLADGSARIGWDAARGGGGGALERQPEQAEGQL
jgi:membrane protein